MSYFLNIGDVVEVSFRGALYGQTTLNIRHYQMTTIVPGFDALTTFQGMYVTMNIAGALLTQWKNMVSTDWTLTDVTFQRIWPLRNARITFADGTTGTVVGSANTANVAAVCTLRTDKATQRNPPLHQGQTSNFHLAGMPTLEYGAGVLPAATLTKLDALAQQLASGITDANGNGMDPVIYHRNVPTTPGNVDVITNYTLNPTVRTQRTRTVGKGI